MSEDFFFFPFIKSVVILLRLVLRYLTFFFCFMKRIFFLITFSIWLTLMHKNTVVFYINLYSAILVNSY